MSSGDWNDEFTKLVRQGVGERAVEVREESGHAAAAPVQAPAEGDSAAAGPGAMARDVFAPRRRQRPAKGVAISLVHSAIAMGIAASLVAITGMARWIAPLVAAAILAIILLARERL